MKHPLRLLPLLAALLLPALCPRAAAQTYVQHSIRPLTDPTSTITLTGELSKDAMAVDQYLSVYSAGYEDFVPGSTLGAPAGRHGVVQVHAAPAVYTGRFVSPEPDSVYTGVAVKATGLEIWVVGTKNVSTTPEWFSERWKPVPPVPPMTTPTSWTRTHWKYASSVPGLAGGVSFGGSIVRYSMGQFLVSGSWTAGSAAGSGPSKLFARALNNSNLSPVGGWGTTVSVINGPGKLGGLDGHHFRWGMDIFRWHPRAYLSSMADNRFYLGGTMNGDIYVNRFHRWDGLPSQSFNNGPPKIWVTPPTPDLMTGLAGLPDSGVYVSGVSQNPTQGFLYCWTRGLSSSSLALPRAGASPWLAGAASGLFDVKVQTIGPVTHVFTGGFSVPMGGGWVWQFEHTGPTGIQVPSTGPTSWPFLPYAAPGHPWVNDLSVYGLDLRPPVGAQHGDLYATGQHTLATGGTGQIAMKVGALSGPSWSLSPPFPSSGTGRRVTGHTIRCPGTIVFSHGNGFKDTSPPPPYQFDGEVMAFTP